jgi:hypothetical protein
MMGNVFSQKYDMRSKVEEVYNANGYFSALEALRQLFDEHAKGFGQTVPTQDERIAFTVGFFQRDGSDVFGSYP